MMSNSRYNVSGLSSEHRYSSVCWLAEVKLSPMSLVLQVFGHKPKLLQFILKGTWKSEQNVITIQPTVVEIFHFKSWFMVALGEKPGHYSTPGDNEPTEPSVEPLCISEDYVVPFSYILAALNLRRWDISSSTDWGVWQAERMDRETLLDSRDNLERLH